ncbi:MAG: hypothetical protein KBD63_05035 [Bacteriovoracaceae bacterium]|nr:hypothetical protein [Bacteriovoracaceae bacterium]
MKNNLKNINSEFEINKEGKLHFYSKAEVTADQVNLVLKKTDIKLMLKPSDHKSH